MHQAKLRSQIVLFRRQKLIFQNNLASILMISAFKKLTPA
ncbi:hypothetical protein VCHE16_3619 [Vibrio paracholerae HE-16]|nr:hypothetical protein VCHE16_3619 [Vibrio paracholerae HE-16]